ncbi:MAG: gluconate transport inducer 1/Pac2, partial [Linnemannia gamsii]
GKIDETVDALIILEACRQGVMPRITRPPNPSLIIPGSVFVFDEQESGICRWTDGKIWSPSRISGNFLVYRE